MNEDFNFLGDKNLDVMDTYADIVYCIDLTVSMTPIINKVKETARQLHSELQEVMLKSYQRNIKRLRIKVVGFRDAYCDAHMAFQVSKFFNLPDETEAFYDFVNSLSAKGGGDVPENALEALAIAMKSDWCQSFDTNIRKRHIIVLFTDAPAHKLEQSREGTDKYYPDCMPKNYSELMDWWGKEKSDGSNVHINTDIYSKRMAVFAPEGAYPWDYFGEGDFDNCRVIYIKPEQGGRDISTEGLIKTLGETLR